MYWVVFIWRRRDVALQRPCRCLFVSCCVESSRVGVLSRRLEEQERSQGRSDGGVGRFDVRRGAVKKIGERKAVVPWALGMRNEWMRED